MTHRPRDWTRKRVSDVCDVVSVGIVIEPSKYYTSPDEGVPAFRSANVGENRIIDEDWVYLTPSGHKTNCKSELISGDVVVVRSGVGAGTACVVTPDYAGTNCIDIVFARPRRDVVLPEYLAEFTNSALGRRHVMGTRGGLAIKHLNVGAYKTLELHLPPIDEQARLVQVFATWNIAAEKLGRLVAAKEERHAALIRRLTAQGSESHRRAPLRDIAERVQRQGDEGEYPLLTISAASGFIRQEDRYSRYMAGESAKTYTLLRSGEFSYNKGNSKRYEFGCIFQLRSYEAALVPSVYVSFRLDDSVSTEYLRHLFLADYLKPQLRALVKTGVRNNGLLNISPEEFMGTTVPLPSLAEQRKIGKILDASRTEIDLLVRERDALRHQKRGLMQKLLTGEWLLPIADEEAV